VSDEQQMLYTATAIVTTGELGISRNQGFSLPRPTGDAVSPYGMGLTLVELPFVALAGPWEMRFGARTSQTLFVLLQVLLVTAAAAGAGLLAGALGAGRSGQALAVFGTSLGSPLWAYTGCGYSEPLQAACLVFGVFGAARAARSDGSRATRFAAACGVATGWLVLTKPVNALFLPLVVLPLLTAEAKPFRARLRLLGAASAGSVLPLATMLGFEVARFGRPFSSYADQRFSHAFLDGAWRLLAGPNKGLFFFFPLSILGLGALPPMVRARATRGPGLAIGALALGAVFLYARWWAWDGTGGWGPRFLVPVVPLLAAAAGAGAVSRRLRLAGAALCAAGVGVNALGALQAEAATFYFLSTTGNASVSRSLYDEYPASFRPPPPGRGDWVLPRFVPAASDAAFSGLRVHPFLLAARLANVDEEKRRARLARPPWLTRYPDAVPVLPPRSPFLTTFTPLLNYLTEHFRWPHLFMSFSGPPGERPGSFSATWVASLADQTLRNLDVGRPDRAARLAAEVFNLAPSGYAAALRLEGLRLSGRNEEARAFLESLPDRARRSPTVLLVEALRARDSGQDDLAVDLLAEAARAIPAPAVRTAVGRPPSAWPRGLREFLAENPDAARVGSPVPPR
jgi:hypothetical protein